MVADSALDIFGVGTIGFDRRGAEGSHVSLEIGLVVVVSMIAWNR